MPYRKCEPAPVDDIERLRYVGHHTVCEKCRELYRIGKELGNPEIMMKAREAMGYAKRMHEQLKKFKEYRESGENQEK